jgi:hypothetical protein
MNLYHYLHCNQPMNLPNLTATKDFIRDKCIRGCDTYEQLNMCSEMIDDYITGRFKRYAPPIELLAAIRELEKRNKRTALQNSGRCV